MACKSWVTGSVAGSRCEGFRRFSQRASRSTKSAKSTACTGSRLLGAALLISDMKCLLSYGVNRASRRIEVSSTPEPAQLDTNERKQGKEAEAEGCRRTRWASAAPFEPRGD